jgi:hypothetical protein
MYFEAYPGSGGAACRGSGGASGGVAGHPPAGGAAAPPPYIAIEVASLGVLRASLRIGGL